MQTSSMEVCAPARTLANARHQFPERQIHDADAAECRPEAHRTGRIRRRVSDHARLASVGVLVHHIEDTRRDLGTDEGEEFALVRER